MGERLLEKAFQGNRLLEECYLAGAFVVVLAVIVMMVVVVTATLLLLMRVLRPIIVLAYPYRVLELCIEDLLVVGFYHAAFAQADRSQFLLEDPAKTDVGVSEQSLESLIVLMHHASQCVQVQEHQLALCERLTVELPLEHVSIVENPLQTTVVVDRTRDDIDLAKVVTLKDLDVDDVMLSALFFEDETGSSFDEEVDAFDGVVLDEDELVLLYQDRLELRTEPCHKLLGLVLEEVDGGVSRLMDQKDALVLQLGRQRLYKVIELIQVVVARELDRVQELDVEIRLHVLAMLFVKIVKVLLLLLELLVLFLLVGDDVRDYTARVCEE